MLILIQVLIQLNSVHSYEYLERKFSTVFFIFEIVGFIKSSTYDPTDTPSHKIFI